MEFNSIFFFTILFFSQKISIRKIRSLFIFDQIKLINHLTFSIDRELFQMNMGVIDKMDPHETIITASVCGEFVRFRTNRCYKLSTTSRTRYDVYRCFWITIWFLLTSFINLFVEGWPKSGIDMIVTPDS